jgi:hypothetical protein
LTPISFGERPIPTCFEAPNIKHWQKNKSLICKPPSSVGYFLFLGGVFPKTKPDQALI